MEISNQTEPFYAFGDNKKIIKLLKESGFTAYDHSMFSGAKNERGEIAFDGHTLIGFDDYVERAAELRKYADEIGIKCNQTHAPFPVAKVGNAEYNEYIHKYIVRAIEVSGILGAKNCVVHPCNNYTAEENAEFYKSLKECAVKNNVGICLENMWNWDKDKNAAVFAACATAEDFGAHLALLDGEIFGACLDLGHAEMMGDTVSATELIYALGDRLWALHIHDNDKHHDLHNVPYTNKMDFSAILNALRDIGYKGDITFESGCSITRLPVELYPAGARYMAEMGRYFKGVILK